MNGNDAVDAPITHVLGARPNFMKAAPVIRALAALGHRQRVVHTGQHYDERMSEVFFVQLGLDRPDVNLGVGSGSHARQTAEIMIGMEQEFTENSPSMAVVYGDVNSTIGAALAGAKLGIPLAHVEAGLRSFDDSMPEEINRRLTDQLCTLLFATSPEAIGHLANEGRPAGDIHLVGNPMIDTLLANMAKFDTEAAREAFGLPGRYVVATLHRQANVDDPAIAAGLVRALHEVATELDVILPVHPRGRERLEAAGLSRHPRVHAVQPLGYLEFMALVRGAAAVITDSGGVQEETTLLRVPCLTLRPNTERPITVTSGSNRLVTREELAVAVRKASDDGHYAGELPPLWDGKAGPRIAAVITAWLDARNTPAVAAMSDSIQRPKAAAGQDGAGHAEELAERVEELVDAGLVDARLVDPELADEGPGAVGIEDAELGDPALTVAAAPVPQAPGLEAERDRLARTLRDTRMQLAMTQARLNALEQSATLVLGRTLVRAAKHPWPRGVQLPAELYRMWRGRGGPSTAPNVPAMASAQLSDMAGAGERFLSALTAPGLTALGAAEAGAAPPAAARRGAPGLVITGLLTARGCADLAPDAAVHPLLPHDADVVLESIGTEPGPDRGRRAAGRIPLGLCRRSASAEPGRRLGRLITAAQALGKPVIFVRNAPPYLAAGLDWIAASCDAVSDGGLGVQLARFNPIGRPPGRPGDPVYAGARDPREPAALRILLDTVTGDGGPVRLTGEVPWQRLPAVYAEHALFLAATADQARGAARLRRARDHGDRRSRRGSRPARLAGRLDRHRPGGEGRRVRRRGPANRRRGAPRAARDLCQTRHRGAAHRAYPARRAARWHGHRAPGRRPCPRRDRGRRARACRGAGPPAVRACRGRAVGRRR